MGLTILISSHHIESKVAMMNKAKSNKENVWISQDIVQLRRTMFHFVSIACSCLNSENNHIHVGVWGQLCDED